MENLFSGSQEALVVGLARGGDRAAFSELVRRRGPWIRNLMQRCSGDAVLADDLAQQVFLQAWKNIGQLREINTFGGWLKRTAITVWLQHQRKHDPLFQAGELDESMQVQREMSAERMDLDRALDQLATVVRTCIVLSYEERMTHAEIAEATDIPLGTVKSHIRRGSAQLKELLSAYTQAGSEEEVS